MTKRLSFEYANANKAEDGYAKDVKALATFLAEAKEETSIPHAVQGFVNTLSCQKEAVKNGSLKILLGKVNNKIVGCLMFCDINNAITVNSLHLANLGAEKEKSLEDEFSKQLDLYKHKQNGKTIIGVVNHVQKPDFNLIFANMVPTLNMGK